MKCNTRQKKPQTRTSEISTNNSITKNTVQKPIDENPYNSICYQALATH